MTSKPQTDKKSQPILEAKIDNRVEEFF